MVQTWRSGGMGRERVAKVGLILMHWTQIGRLVLSATCHGLKIRVESGSLRLSGDRGLLVLVRR